MSVASLETAALVIDCGSGSTKAGFAGDDAPRSVFPSKIGWSRMPGIMVGLEDREIYAGEEVNAKRSVLTIKQPIQRRRVVDWESMEMLWNYTLYTELKIPPEDHAILLSEPPRNTKEARKKVISIMFDYFNVPCLYLSNQGVLSLCASGRTTGLVVDSGEGATHTVPIHEGYAIPHGIEELELAGTDLTRYLQQLMVKKYGLEMERPEYEEYAQKLKEKYCRVAEDYEGTVKETAVSAEHEAKETLPDGKTVTLSAERYKVPEVLFQPGLLDMKLNGIHKYANESVKKCDESIKEALYANVLLAGGSTLFPGLGMRLKQEMKDDAKKNINCVAPVERKYTTWIGGSIIASLSTFQVMWITKAEYLEIGESIVNRKCF